MESDRVAERDVLRVARAALIVAVVGQALLFPGRGLASRSHPKPLLGCRLVGTTLVCDDEDDGGGGGDGGAETPEPPPPDDGDDGGGTPAAPPTATPDPWPEVETFYCMNWPDCPSGWATVTAVRGPDGRFYTMDAVCLSEEACLVPTAVPGDGDDWPCDEPPTIDGGIIHQPCAEWPGWYIDVEVSIPPAQSLRNPWPRSLVALETQFWYLGAGDVEAFSEEMALACPNAAPGVRHGSSTFDCGGGVGRVTEGAVVNYQIGAAWRQWNAGDGAIFGQTPPGESVWVIEDRAENGGSQLMVGPQAQHVFETSSWGLAGGGPTWNEACQERSCSCDERVASPTGAEAYDVSLTTYWWPEYTFRYLEYRCTHTSTRCEHHPGSGSLECDLDGDGADDVDSKRVSYCDQWGWRRVTEPWQRYDLRQMGHDPLVASTAAVVAGADAAGNQCGSFISSLDVPVIEVQPVAPGE